MKLKIGPLRISAFCFVLARSMKYREIKRDRPKISYARYESTFLHLELSVTAPSPRVIPPTHEPERVATHRYGFKLYRYKTDQCGPSLRAWWGKRESGRIILWGERGPAGYEGAQLHEEVIKRQLGIWQGQPVETPDIPKLK